jgi:filamentous hemagglutinin
MAPGAAEVIAGVNQMNPGGFATTLMIVSGAGGGLVGTAEIAGLLGSVTYRTFTMGVPAGLEVSTRGLDLVSRHLARFGPDNANSAMLARLHTARLAGARIQGADANFYLHEAAEATKLRGVAWFPGSPEQLAAHNAAMAQYGVSPFSLYHPLVLRAMPGAFHPRYYRYWGIQ